MKASVLVLCVGVVVSMICSVQAQCGCSAPVVSPVYAPMVSHVAPPIRQYSPSSIAYVNKLSEPVSRGTYSLNYAIHLTDGRVLLTDFLPSGHTVRGTEYRSGSGGRKMIASPIGTGVIRVSDPQSNQVIANLGS